MGVDHRRAHVLVTEKFLNSPDIISVLEQMGGKRVAKGVTRSHFSKPRLFDGPLHRALQKTFIDVMSPVPRVNEE